MARKTKVAVRSKHKDFAPIDSVREVTLEEARLLQLIGRAEFVRGGEFQRSDSPPARELASVKRRIK